MQNNNAAGIGAGGPPGADKGRLARPRKEAGAPRALAFPAKSVCTYACAPLGVCMHICIGAT